MATETGEPYKPRDTRRLASPHQRKVTASIPLCHQGSAELLPNSSATRCFPTPPAAGAGDERMLLRTRCYELSVDLQGFVHLLRSQDRLYIAMAGASRVDSLC
jgi:hypothetical protein